MLEKQLQAIIRKAVKKTFVIDLVAIPLEHPQDSRRGDYASSLPLVLSKTLNQPPMAIANRLVKALNGEQTVFGRWAAAPPGFLNLTLSPPFLLQEMLTVFREKDRFGDSKKMAGEKIMVEFAHPNTHKEFHIGHLRNLCLGESLVRLLESQGVQVVRANYQGDVGLHVAKALWGFLKVLSTKYEVSSMRKMPLQERAKLLAQAYVEGQKAYAAGGETAGAVMEINRKIYAQDPKILPLWRETRQWSLDYFDAIYRRLGTRFDRFYFESEVADSGLEIVRAAQKQGILKESEEAVVFDGSTYGLDTRVFVTREGLPTYEAKELGLAASEFSEFGEIDKCLHVVAPEQTSFFKITFKVEELLAPDKFAGKQEHVAYGYVDLKEGKMSSRTGQVVAALAVLEAAKAKAGLLSKKVQPSEGCTFTESEREEIAEKVAVGAVKYSLLKQSARKNIAFDLAESVALAGNSGPYLQYTYARAKSVIRKWEIGSGKLDNLISHLSSQSPASYFSFPTSAVAPEERALLRTFHRFPEIVQEAAQGYAPHFLAEYLYDLAQKFNLFYNNVRILEGNKESGIRNQGVGGVNAGHNSLFAIPHSRLRLALTAATAQILKNGLHLLGIEVLERM